MQDYPGDKTLTHDLPQKPVVVIGGINLDIKGVSTGPLVTGTSNPGTAAYSAGGVGRNIAENLARLGIQTVLLGAVGSDRFSRYILEKTAEAGVDVSGVLKAKGFTAGVYVSLSDNNQEHFTAVSDMRVTEMVSPAYLNAYKDEIAGCGMLVVDTNLSCETLSLSVETAKKHDIPVLIEPVSVEKALKLRNTGVTATYMTPNTLEYRAITGEEPVLHRPNACTCAATVFVTSGARGVLKLHSDQRLNRHFESPPVHVVDQNGAGDAFTAGFIAGLLYGLTEDEAVIAGIRAARLTLESPRTVSSGLTRESISGDTKEERRWIHS